MQKRKYAIKNWRREWPGNEATWEVIYALDEVWEQDWVLYLSPFRINNRLIVAPCSAWSCPDLSCRMMSSDFIWNHCDTLTCPDIMVFMYTILMWFLQAVSTVTFQLLYCSLRCKQCKLTTVIPTCKSVIQNHPLYRMCFGQQQASSVVLGWPGDGDC